MIIDDVANFKVNAVAGNSYYVSITGNDNNDGSLNHPWRTVQKAANTMIAGDCVFIMQGTYKEQVIGKNNGESDAYIIFTNYQNDEVIIDGSNMTSTWDGLMAFRGQHHIRISGLKIANSSAYGLFFPGSEGHIHDIIIDNCEIYGHSLSGIYFYPPNPTFANDILIENNIIHHCQNWWNHQPHGPNETVTLSNVDGFIFRNNYLYFNHKLPFDAKNNSRNGQIYRNIIDTYADPNNGCAGFYIDAYDDHAMDIDLFSNIVYGPYTGYTIGTEQGGTLHRIRLFNNIYHGTGHGFQINDHWQYVDGEPGINHVKEDCSVINNTFVNASVAIFITDLQESFYNFTIRNNILSAERGVYVPSKGVNLDTQNFDHNLFDEIKTSIYLGTDYIKAAPQFVDKINNNFHLKSTSPCINTGNNLNAPDEDFDFNPRGVEIDIGAFEYQE